MNDPKAWYVERLEDFQHRHERLNRMQRRLMWWRMAGFLGGLLAFFFCLREYIVWGLLGLGGGWSFFFWAVQKDTELRKMMHDLKARMALINREMDALDGGFPHVDAWVLEGETQHAYAADLDVFGPGSLFHYINRCYSQDGIAALKEWLGHASPLHVVRKRQTAVQELALLPDWRMDMECATHDGTFMTQPRTDLRAWVKGSNVNDPYRYLSWMPWLTLTLGGLLLAWVFVFHGPSLALYIWFASLLVALRLLRPALLMELNSFEQVAPHLEQMSKRLDLIYVASFQSELLNALRLEACQSDVYRLLRAAHTRRLLHQIHWRNNLLLYALGNLFFFWDGLLYKRITAIKSRLQNLLPPCLEALSAFEALSSLANLTFNKPQWCFPSVTDTPGIWEAEGMGHPMLKASICVTNSLSWKAAPTVVLITGSNMAGKSTFLRSVGLNTVLAMCGAPVCAQTMKCSYWEVWSSMRVVDNLQENTSTFHAELKRLLQMLEGLHAHRPQLMLLDEILRGTNSADRHAGTRALIRDILAYGGVALLASHDLDLCTLESRYPTEVSNYHFDISIVEGQLQFDYLLRPGVCRNMNASFLLGQIGLQLLPEDYDSPRNG